MRKSAIPSLCFALTLAMCGCHNTSDKTIPMDNTIPTENNSESETVPKVDFTLSDEDMFSENDYITVPETDEDDNIIISLNGNSATCSSNKVSINKSTVTIKDEGTYIISGTLTNGMIVVDANKAKPHIIFDGVSISNNNSCAIKIIEADKVFITLNDGVPNTLSNEGTFNDDKIDGVIFSKQDLTFNGKGDLTITSKEGHGIVCKDDLVFTGGNYTINCASHGLDVNDSVRIDNTNLNIDAGKDGIHCENSDNPELGYIYISSGDINIEAEGDGISAYYYVQIEDGNFDITAGGGSVNGESHSSGGFGGFMGGKPGFPGSNNNSSNESTDNTSMKAIKATGSILIKKGTFNINSADDAIHANDAVTIYGGNMKIETGDDGLHADNNLTINNGTIDITKCYEGLEATHIVVNGGNIKMVATDDGINAAGGVDQSGGGGRDNGMFGGGGPGGHGGPGGMSSNSNGSIKITGGTLYINSSGDGMDANGTLEISGGHTTVVGPTQGDTATLDFDVSGVISGGTFIGTGSTMMAHTFSSSENQGVIAINAGPQSANTKITLTDSKGNIIIERTPELSFAVVILSSPDIVKGETYTITIGTISGAFEAY